MSISHPRFTARIEGSSETIFDLIADMPNYGRWLPGSEAFAGTTEVSPYPVRLGTTYLDAGPAGQRPGSVTRYDPPKYIAFHHTMLLKRGPLTPNVDVHIRYTFEPVERATCVIPRSRSHDPNIRHTEGGGAPGRIRVSKGECADTRGAETLRRSATEATRSQPILARNQASMRERIVKLLSR